MWFFTFQAKNKLYFLKEIPGAIIICDLRMIVDMNEINRFWE